MSQISFGVSRDAKWITELLSRPEIMEMSFPDGVGAPTENQINDALGTDNMDFVQISVDGVALGFFLLELRFPIVEIHTVISKEHRGSGAFKAAKTFPEWFFKNYQACNTLLTQVPKYNRAAALFAVRGGMHRSDMQGDMFCKNGKSENMDIYVIERCT